MKCTADDLIRKADQLFALQAPVKRMWQVVADNFYPMRSDFDAASAAQNIVKEPADWLADSYPILCHRDLSNSIDPMLRDGNWFQMTLGEGEQLDRDGKLWMEDKTRRMRELMGQRESGFSRATKQGDNDFMAFGQCVIQVGLRRDLRGLLYQNWHLRDCAWFDDDSGNVGGFVRVWRPTREQAMLAFGLDKMHASSQEGYRREPFHREEFLHLVLPAHMLEDLPPGKFPWVSVWVDRTHQHIIEKSPLASNPYVVPRFFTLAESPYAYSPATMAALPDARTLQAMTFTLLEAAEKYSNPPIVATMDAIIGTIDLGPSGVTYVDNEYDERTGNALRPLLTDKGGYPIGQNERSRVVETLRAAFYLDRISMPQKEQEMTAYEVAEMMKEYRRANLPLFQPIEVEYNGQICEATFDVLMRGRYFGPVTEIPESLQGKDVRFKYKSPLSSAEEQTRTAKFGQMQLMLSNAIQLDPTLADVPDLEVAMRSAIEAMDVPSDWIRSEKAYQERVQQRIETAMMAQQAGAMGGEQAA